MVQGSETSVELDYLNSLTEYQVAVFSVYRSSASEALRGSATTCEFFSFPSSPKVPQGSILGLISFWWWQSFQI